MVVIENHPSGLGNGAPNEPENSLSEKEAYMVSDMIAPFYL